MTTITAERAQAGYALANDEGEAFWLLGMLQTIKIGRDDTAGRYGMAEIVVPEGIGSPWHVHPEEDEWFYVLGGLDDLLGRRHAHVPHSWVVRVRPQGRTAHLLRRRRRGDEPWSGSHRCSSKDSSEKPASPPPSASCHRRSKAPRTSPGFPRSQSGTASRSSARQAPRPATNPPPGDVRPLRHGRAHPAIQSGDLP